MLALRLALALGTLPLLLGTGTAQIPHFSGDLQLDPGSGQAAACATDFDRLVRKVEEDYAGYHLEVTPATRRAYEHTRDMLRARAAGADGDQCYFVLRDFVAHFQDPHLFVFQSARLDSAETRRRAAAVERVRWGEADVRAWLEARAGRLDPLEGIWYDGNLRVAVLGDSTRRGQFRAIVLTSDTSIWEPGAVRAHFTRLSDGAYDAILWGRNYSYRYLDARLHKRVLLRFSPGMWGKEFPVVPADRGLLDPLDAHRPTITERSGSIVVSIPSHDPALKPRLDSLVEQHRPDLAGTSKLIIDLRGNEGGGTLMTSALEPYLASDSLKPAVLPDGPPVMLSSPDQIRYVQRFWVSDPDTAPTVQRLLARLRANPGRFVALGDSLDPPPPAQDSVAPGRRAVGILVDRGTVSAAEAFLLRAMRSYRVTVFGEPTAGALDYQTVYIVPFQANGPRWYLGYPTITAHLNLPAGGIKGRGIAPHVSVDWAREADPIALVASLLARP